MKVVRTEQCPWCGSVVSRTKFLEIESRIRLEETEKSAIAERNLTLRLQEQFSRDLENTKRAAMKEAREATAKEVKEANAQRLAAEARVKEMALRETSMRERIEAAAQSQTRKEIAHARTVLEKDRDLALLKQQAEYNREREAFQKKVKLMEHQLRKKTSNELGDGAEIDLYEALRDTFSDDRIRRIAKGTNGADIKHEVLYKGALCGSIVIDCKHRLAWQNTFVSKLKQDQLEAGADHAILSSGVFPSGHKEMHISSGVIIVSPARVPYIVEILRKAMIAMHVRGLGMNERSSKTNSLYEFLTSESYSQRFMETRNLTEGILSVDVDEKKAHDSIWKKRGTLVRRLSGVLREIDTEISSIVEGPAQDKPPARKNPASETFSKVKTEIPYGTRQ